MRLVFGVVAILAWASSIAAYLFFGRAVDLSVVLMTSGVATALFGPSIWRHRDDGDTHV